jgi:RNA polymerase sigma-70 factor (ECF subfamily)
MDTLTDRELVKRAKEGEQRAFTVLMERYGKGLALHIGEYMANCRSCGMEMAVEAEDICQEAFHKAFAGIRSYNEQYEFSTWLYTIGKNCVIDYTRKRKILVDAGITADVGDSLSNYGGEMENSPEDEMISNQEYSILLKYISELGEKYRSIAMMRFINELAYEEIAQKLDMPLNTVRTRLKRAKEMLVRRVEDGDVKKEI